MPPPSSASGRTFIPRMRQVRDNPTLQRSGGSFSLNRFQPARSAIGEAVSRAVDRHARGEGRIDHTGLAPQSLDMAVNRAIVDKNNPRIGRPEEGRYGEKGCRT